MEPGLRSGDLVVARDRGSYEVGDAILFRDPQGGTTFHRIVAVEAGGYVTRGDNSIDEDSVTVPAQDVIGGEWLALPRVGDGMDWLTAPAHYGPLALTVTLVLLLVIRRSLRRRDVVRSLEAGDPLPREWLPPQMLRSLCLGTGLAGALFGGLALYSWATPEHRSITVPDALVETGTFSYGATVRASPVYPEGRLTTGQVAFTRLVDQLDVAFEYRLRSTERTSVRGGLRLDAVLSDGRGWTRLFPIVAERPFSGASASVEGTLSVRAITAAARQMRRLTGSTDTEFALALQPHVELAGYVGSIVVDSDFAPRLIFRFDGVALTPVSGEQGLQAELRPRASHPARSFRETSLGVRGVEAATADVRRAAALGLFTSLLLFGLAAVLLAVRVVGGEAARIAARYGQRILDARIVLPEGRWVTEVEDIETLVRLAEHYDRPVLHCVEGMSHLYVVDDGVAVYRFRLAEPALAGHALRSS